MRSRRRVVARLRSGADVGRADEVARSVAELVDVLGPPTVLINNAGITRDNRLPELSEDDWDAVVSVHLRGSFLMSRAVQPFLVEAGRGRIVNFSSTSALGSGGMANHASAVAGIEGLTGPRRRT